MLACQAVGLSYSITMKKTTASSSQKKEDTFGWMAERIGERKRNIKKIKKKETQKYCEVIYFCPGAFQNKPTKAGETHLALLVG